MKNRTKIVGSLFTLMALLSFSAYSALVSHSLTITPAEALSRIFGQDSLQIEVSEETTVQEINSKISKKYGIKKVSDLIFTVAQQNITLPNPADKSILFIPLIKAKLGANFNFKSNSSIIFQGAKTQFLAIFNTESGSEQRQIDLPPRTSVKSVYTEIVKQFNIQNADDKELMVFLDSEAKGNGTSLTDNAQKYGNTLFYAPQGQAVFKSADKFNSLYLFVMPKALNVTFALNGQRQSFGLREIETVRHIKNRLKQLFNLTVENMSQLKILIDHQELEIETSDESFIATIEKHLGRKLKNDELFVIEL